MLASGLVGAVIGLVVTWLISPLLPDSPLASEQPRSFQLSTLQTGCRWGQVSEIVKFVEATEENIDLRKGADRTVICADGDYVSKRSELAKVLAKKFPGCFALEKHINNRLYLRLDSESVCESKFVLVDKAVRPATGGDGLYVCLGNKAKLAQPQFVNLKATSARACAPAEISPFGFK